VNDESPLKIWIAGIVAIGMATTLLLPNRYVPQTIQVITSVLRGSESTVIEG
jgi:hypothetical protein